MLDSRVVQVMNSYRKEAFSYYTTGTGIITGIEING